MYRHQYFLTAEEYKRYRRFVRNPVGVLPPTPEDDMKSWRVHEPALDRAMHTASVKVITQSCTENG